MKNRGFSLIEILVVLGIFAVLASLATQGVLLTLKSARKSESSIKVRENLNYAMGVMERQLRNASDIDTSSCISRVDYTDNLIPANNTFFRCFGTPNFYVASGSARLTSSEVKVTSCNFTCDSTSNSVTISLTGTSATATGVENATETVNSTIFLRQGN